MDRSRVDRPGCAFRQCRQAPRPCEEVSASGAENPRLENLTLPHSVDTVGLVDGEQDGFVLAPQRSHDVAIGGQQSFTRIDDEHDAIGFPIASCA